MNAKKPDLVSPQQKESEYEKKILEAQEKAIPNLRRACSEKLNYYRSQIDRDEMSTPLKTIIQRCIKKNERYLTCIEKLFEHSNFKTISNIIQPS